MENSPGPSLCLKKWGGMVLQTNKFFALVLLTAYALSKNPIPIFKTIEKLKAKPF